MNVSTVSTRGGVGRRAMALILGAMIACLGVFAFAGPAKAAPGSMELTNGQINLGFAFKGAEILPAPATVQLAAPPAPATPLPDLWDARDTIDTVNPAAAYPAGCLTPAQLNLTVDPIVPVGPPLAACGGNPASATVGADVTANSVTVTATADGGLNVPGTNPPTSYGLPNDFRFPIMVVPNPLDNSPVPITLAATGNLTGSYDAGTGALDLNGPIEARVLTGLASNPLGEYCAVPLVGLSLSTTSNADFPGVPFTAGFDGTGALTGTFNIVDNSTSVGGADCATVDQVSKGAGSIWLSNGIAEPPVCPDNTTGIPPDCLPIPCEAGFTGNEPDCVKLKAKITKLSVSGPSKVLKGNKAVYKVSIKNGGNAKAKGVRLKVTGKGVSFNTSVGKIGAKKTKTVKVRNKFKKRGKVKAKFKVTSNNAGGKTKTKKVKVK